MANRTGALESITKKEKRKKKENYNYNCRGDKT
jgi:hypothetical protein